MKRLLCLIMCVCLLAGCSTAGAKQTVFAMDTVMDLQVWGKDAKTAIAQLQDMILALESNWSVTDSGSVLHRMHASQISAEDQQLLTRVTELSQRTGGLYDPQLYSLCSAWGLYGQNYRVPTQMEITLALADDQWDLGGALKGHCGDQAVKLLEHLNISHAILNLGGNIQTYGNKPDGTPWQIGIQNPEGGDPLGILSVTGTTAVVTSGDYQRSFEADGKRYHHILDPRTGYPADSGLRSVTVICSDGLTADCLSTALFVMGLEDATAFWRNDPDFEAVFLTADGKLYATEGARLSGCEFEVIAP